MNKESNCSEPGPAWCWNVSRGRSSTTSLNEKFQCLFTLAVKDFLFMCKLNLLSFSLKTFLLALPSQILLKISSLPSCSSPLDTERLLSSHLGAFSSSDWTVPAHTACPHKRGVPCLGSFVRHSSGHSPTGLCLSCPENSTSGCSTPGENTPTHSRGAGSPPSTCWPLFFFFFFFYPAQNMVSFLVCKGTLLANVQLVTPVPPSLFWMGCAQPFHLPACIGNEGFLDPSARAFVWICWTLWGSPGPTAQACLGLPGWHPVPLVCWLHFTAWCHLQMCWECTRPHCQCRWLRY